MDSSLEVQASIDCSIVKQHQVQNEANMMR